MPACKRVIRHVAIEHEHWLRIEAVVEAAVDWALDDSLVMHDSTCECPGCQLKAAVTALSIE